MEWFQISKKLPYPEASWNLRSQTQQHWKLTPGKSKHLQWDESPTFSSYSERVWYLIYLEETIMSKIWRNFWCSLQWNQVTSFTLNLLQPLFWSFPRLRLNNLSLNMNFGLKMLSQPQLESLMFYKKMDLLSGNFFIYLGNLIFSTFKSTRNNLKIMMIMMTTMMEIIIKLLDLKDKRRN